MITKLCSEYNEENEVVCDRPEGHEGDHRATVYWSDDEERGSRESGRRRQVGRRW